MNKKNFNKFCNEARLKILKMSQKVTALHMGGALSCIEIVSFIYLELMKKNKLAFDNIFLMSKGHSCIAQYIILNKFGILKNRDLDLYCKKGGFLGCHPDYGVKGIEASTGSLGHGMGLATGMAHVQKIQKSKKKIFVVLSDGELQEGSTWESMMMSANLELDNLFVFLDHNGSQSFGKTKETHPKFYPIKNKVLSFNWRVFEANGHSYQDLIKMKKLIYSKNKFKKPTFIICNTIKGKGISYMENKPIWHYRSPNQEEYLKALVELSNNNEK